MIRSIIILTITTAISFRSRAAADLLELSGEYFKPGAPVEWAATNVLPKTITVYKVVPQQLSQAVISNAMAIASFKPVNRIKSDKNTLEFRDNRERPARFLRINPTVGWIWYLDEKAIVRGAAPPEGVPAGDEVEKLARNCLPLFGIDTNQITFHPQSRIVQRSEHWDKKGHWSGERTNLEGISISRQLDGISLGNGGYCGGFTIQFANNAKVQSFEMLWRKFQPQKQYKTAVPDEIIAKIKAGLAVKPVESEDISQAKRFTVVKITPFYKGRPASEPQELMYPMATIELFAEINATNRVFFYLHCPILGAEITSNAGK